MAEPNETLILPDEFHCVAVLCRSPNGHLCLLLPDEPNPDERAAIQRLMLLATPAQGNA
jgi:6-phosphogluconolactonase/glucosamine-6-phosphate isomerase/deaminase